MTQPPMGKIVWTDLTIPNAPQVRDFYAQDFGWKVQDVDMGDHSDFTMVDPASGDSVVGVCHALGENATQPPQWINYFSVANLEDSIKEVEQNGGKGLTPGRGGGGWRFCVIQDPGGAVCGLIETSST